MARKCYVQRLEESQLVNTRNYIVTFFELKYVQSRKQTTFAVCAHLFQHLSSSSEDRGIVVEIMLVCATYKLSYIELVICYKQHVFEPLRVKRVF